MVIEKALEYCRSVLKNVSRSFALTIPMIEKNMVIPILVGYLEARILDSFEDEKGNKTVNREERIEKMKKVISIISDPDSMKSKKNMEDIIEAAPDFITNPHYLDLTRNMDKVIAVHNEMDIHAKSTISLWFGRMAVGMEKYLDKRIDTFEQLDEYCYYVGGTVGGLVTDLIIRNTEKATPTQIETLKIERNDFGLFLQKVNIIRDFRQDILNNEKIFWPYEIFQEQKIVPTQALERNNEIMAMTILKKMISNSKKHITPVKNYISAIPEDYPGFKNASIINFLLGIETLTKVKNNPDVFYSDVSIKVDKSLAKEIIADPLKSFEDMSIKI